MLGDFVPQTPYGGVAPPSTPRCVFFLLRIGLTPSCCWGATPPKPPGGVRTYRTGFTPTPLRGLRPLRGLGVNPARYVRTPLRPVGGGAPPGSNDRPEGWSPPRRPLNETTLGVRIFWGAFPLSCSSQRTCTPPSEVYTYAARNSSEG